MGGDVYVCGVEFSQGVNVAEKLPYAFAPQRGQNLNGEAAVAFGFYYFRYCHDCQALNICNFHKVSDNKLYDKNFFAEAEQKMIVAVLYV